ncbi:MAG: hypothetical protein BWK79_19285 [Beggiatoa sp. IS2]|nr:MAG: hypothetical protein BWK79_19285 [Beggiatoa sp. IS2]
MSKKNNFIDLCLSGDVLLEEIDEWIDEWHDSPQKQELHDFLGMNWAEYSSWVSMPEILPFIVTAHKENKNFIDLLEEIQSLPIAARADAKLEVNKLVEWLKAQNML